MYKEIDELIEAIKKDDIFQAYIKAQRALDNLETRTLLSKHQQLQEDYARIKKYRPNDDIKEELKKVKKEMISNQSIQDYYQAYYALNDLLNEITHVIFDGISDELIVGALKF